MSTHAYLERRNAATERRRQALVDFPAAQALASASGLTLSKSDTQLYRLTFSSGARLDLLPGPQRIAVVLGRPPRIKVGKPWRLGDVITAAIQAFNGDWDR